MCTNNNAFTILKCMFGDSITINKGTVGAAEVFNKGIIENSEYLCMRTTDCKVIDMYVVIRFSPDS